MKINSDKAFNLLSFVFAICGFLLFLLYIGPTGPNFGTDWITSFKPAILAFLHGENPYINSYGFFNPPWAMIPFVPLILLSDKIVSVIFFCMSILVFGFVAYKMGAPIFAAIFFALSPFVIRCANDPNIDWLIVLGFLLPPKIGLFFVLAKPQIGWAVALFWFIEAWENGKFREILKTFSPVVICYIISFLIFGFWPLNSFGLEEAAHNTSLFPMSIPIGLGFLVMSLRKRNLGNSIISAPLLSPYVGPVSWGVPILGILPNKWEFLFVVLGTWIIQFITKTFI